MNLSLSLIFLDKLIQAKFKNLYFDYSSEIRSESQDLLWTLFIHENELKILVPVPPPTEW